MMSNNVIAVNSEPLSFRVEARCQLLTWLINLPLGLSRKRAKDLLRFRAVHVKKKPGVGDGIAGKTDSAAANLETGDAAAARGRERPITGLHDATGERRDAGPARGRARPSDARPRPR